jgi:hypothetical protein
MPEITEFVMKKAFLFGMVTLIGAGGAVQSQSPASAGGLVHPGTAILDSMGIFAGSCQGLVSTLDRPTHPGTAILDSMGIFAGTPSRDPAVNDDAYRAASTATPN